MKARGRGLPARFLDFNIIPEKWKRSMLRLLFPELDGIVGFPSYYDRRTLAAFEKLARAQGLAVIEKKPYYRSDSFIFFAPLTLSGGAGLPPFTFPRKTGRLKPSAPPRAKSRDESLRGLFFSPRRS